MTRSLTSLESISNLNDLENLDFSVSTCFIESHGKFLVLQRGRKDDQYGLWGIPGGKLAENESARRALIREVFEETQIAIDNSNLELINISLSVNEFDGKYLLYIFYYHLNNDSKIILNPEEHLDSMWVSFDEFKNLNLLVSQGQAFNIVESKLKILIEDKHHVNA